MKACKFSNCGNMYTYTFLAMLILITVSGELSVPKNYENDSKAIQACLGRISSKSFSQNPILVLADFNMSDYVPRAEKAPQVRYNFQENHHLNEPFFYSNHILVGSSLQNLRETYEKYYQSSLYNRKFTPKGNVLIYAPKLDELEETMTYFWAKYVTSIVYLNGTEIWATYPFWGGSNCGKNVLKKRRLVDCFEQELEDWSMLWERFPKNLTGCTMTAATFGLHIKMPYLDDGNLLAEKTGIFIKPLRLLTSKYGLKINYVVPNDEAQFTFPIVGTKLFLKELYETQIYDLLVVEPFRLPNTSLYYESSEVIIFERKIWIAPKPVQLSKITVLLKLFQLNLWLAWLAILFLTTFLTRLLSTQHDSLKAFFMVFSMAIGSSTNFLPGSLKMRLLLLFYLVYSFHIIYFFQGQLSSVLTSPAYEAPINSLERLSRSNLLVVFYYDINLETFRNSLNAHVRSMRNRSFLYETDDYNPAQLVLDHRNFSSSAFAHNSNISEAHKKQLVIFPDTILYSFEATYTARKAYPILQTLNQILVRLREAGLPYKWLSDLQKIAFLPEADGNSAVVLSFDHLQAAFLLLVFGLFMSILVFFAELFLFKK